MPERVFRQANERFYDTATGHGIAVKRLRYKGKVREVMVAYDERRGVVELVTIHPLQPEQKQARLASGRWQPR